MKMTKVFKGERIRSYQHLDFEEAAEIAKTFVDLEFYVDLKYAHSVKDIVTDIWKDKYQLDIYNEKE